MEATIHITEKRMHIAIDLLCTLLIGLGLGGLGMYWYAITNPQDITGQQTHTLVTPQIQSNNQGNDSTTGKLQLESSGNEQQI